MIVLGTGLLPYTSGRPSASNPPLLGVTFVLVLGVSSL
jgi:hypothetical protein